MKLQQLIVESNNSSDHDENVVVGMSSSIKPELLTEAVNLSTTRREILSGQNAAIFYCRSRAGTGMIGRSYAAGFDSEGNRPLRTHLVLVSSNQLKCYYNNPVLIARSLNSCGAWILKTIGLEPELPELEMSDSVVNTFAYPEQVEQVTRTVEAMESHDQIAVTDASRPLDFVGQVLQTFSFGERSKISFALDRRVTAETPFRISAYTRGDVRLEHDLTHHRVFPVRLRTKLVRTS